MTAREIKSKSGEPPPRNEVYSIGAILSTVQLLVIVGFWINPNRDELRDATSNIKRLTESQIATNKQLSDYVAEEARRREVAYQDKIMDLQERNKKDLALQRMQTQMDGISSYFNLRQSGK